ncbi:MAG: HypC/HybG/HupF family hydrogenase formation chaperone [Alphaproteobacteria bacterium]
MCLAVPGELIDISGDDPLTRIGRIAFGGVIKEASLAFVPEARPGDYVLVHAGVAISVLDAAAAEASLACFTEPEGGSPEGDGPDGGGTP